MTEVRKLWVGLDLTDEEAILLVDSLGEYGTSGEEVADAAALQTKVADVVAKARKKRTEAMEPTIEELAGDDFSMIESIVGNRAIREAALLDSEATTMLVIDGAQYSPSMRALPGARAAWELADVYGESLWELYENRLDMFCSLWNQGESHPCEEAPVPTDDYLSWEDGCLWMRFGCRRPRERTRVTVRDIRADDLIENREGKPAPIRSIKCVGPDDGRRHILVEGDVVPTSYGESLLISVWRLTDEA